MNIRLNLILLYGMLIFVSCTEYVDINLNTDENSYLVVEGSITNEYKKHSVRLTHTASYFDNKKAQAVQNATIRLSGNEKSYTYTETDSAGVYLSPRFSAAEEQIYRLDIELENGKTYFAETYLKKKVPIDSIMTTPLYMHPWSGNKGYDIIIFFDEPAGRGDAYIWDLFIDNKLVTDTLRDKQFLTDINFDGKPIKNLDVFWLRDKDFDADTLDLMVRMQRVEEEYFDFIIGLFLETDFRGGMFDGPPANVKTNMSDGAIGYFYAAGTSMASIKLIRESTE